MNITIKHPRVLLLVDHVLNKMSYGDFICHEDMSRLISSEHMSQEYNMIISKANDLLMLKGKVITNVHACGYRVLMPDGYNNHVANVVAKGMKYIAKAACISTHAPVDLMSPTHKKRHQEVTKQTLSFSERTRQRHKEITVAANN
jgi:hypothetical protein